MVQWPMGRCWCPRGWIGSGSAGRVAHSVVGTPGASGPALGIGRLDSSVGLVAPRGVGGCGGVGGVRGGVHMDPVEHGAQGRVSRPVVGSENLDITTGTGQRSVVCSVVLVAPGGWQMTVMTPVGGAASASLLLFSIRLSQRLGSRLDVYDL